MKCGNKKTSGLGPYLGWVAASQAERRPYLTLAREERHPSSSWVQAEATRKLDGFGLWGKKAHQMWVWVYPERLMGVGDVSKDDGEGYFVADESKTIEIRCESRWMLSETMRFLQGGRRFKCRWVKKKTVKFDLCEVH